MNLSRTLHPRRRAPWRAALFALVLAAGTAAARAEGERRFATPEEALQALTTASLARDTNALHALFGPRIHHLVSPEIVEASAERDMFLNRIRAKAVLAHPSPDRVQLELGVDAWPFPVPLVRADGKWRFDTAAGEEEILNRRIGRNELNAIEVCRAYVAAQREYAAADRDGDGVVEYARRLRSTPGSRDGLYWPSAEGEEPSPLGPLISEAGPAGGATAPYRGYDFKILTEQGAHAPGGRWNYVIHGHMVAGFGLAAWPAQWGATGAMTFIVNQQGKVFQKNLGPKTSSLAPKMVAFDPDPTWTPVPDR